LVGAGIAGVAGASALAYADTVKPAVSDVGAEAAIPTYEELVPSPADNLPPAPDVVTTTEAPPPPPIPETTVEQQAPVATYTPVPEYTPQYTPEQTVEQAPPVTNQAPATKTQAPPTTKRRNLTPTTVMAPNYSPHVTISRGS